MRPRHRLVARFLLAVSLLGAAAAHSHSILEDASSNRPAAPQLDPRCALSTALSLHAIPRIVEREMCWACHWHRHFTISLGPAPLAPVGPGRTLAPSRPPSEASLARLTRLSRGPPSVS